MKLRFLLPISLAISVAAIAQTTADNAKPPVPPAGASSAAPAAAPDPLVDARALMSKKQFVEAAAAFQAILAN